MLTNEEIQKIEPINKEAVEFFLKLAEDRLADSLGNRKDLENKAFILFAGYTASISALLALSERLGSPLMGLSIGLFIAGLICLGFCIKTRQYGVMGREPRIWLNDDVYIKRQDKNYTALFKAYVLHDYDDHIEISVNQNSVKAKLINIALSLGGLAIIPLALMLII
jgi:hypothetical protein